MIHALRYEPQGQRQRFEPQEQQSGDVWHKHFHLHIHLHLSSRVRRGRFSPLSAVRLTRIFAALVGATYMVFMLMVMVLVDQDPSTSPLYAIAGNMILAGLALAWGTVALGGLPLLVSAWRSTPRVRFLLALPLILLLIIPLNRAIPKHPHSFLLNPLVWFFIVFILAPLISTSLLIRAFRQAAIADKWLRFASRISFVTVGAMLLLLFGGFLLCLATMQVALMNYPWLLPPLLGICIAVIVAVSTLFGWPRSREQARPKDASPFEVASSGESREGRG